jgi:hypothetical protein
MLAISLRLQNERRYPPLRASRELLLPFVDSQFGAWAFAGVEQR